MKPPVPRVHVITDGQVAVLPNLESVAAALAISPAVAFHARLPKADGARVWELATRLRKATGPRSLIIVNDRLDVARIVSANGVHLPENGLPIEAARQLLAPGQLLGRSVHDPEEARRAAAAGADYVLLGPVWETASHPERPIGLGALRGLEGITVIAIGGVTPERAKACRDAGAWGVAAISALWRAPDPAAAVSTMLLSFV
ncbi:MAG: thiamine phosphate synthase [Gemmatimonadetes bacterium]|nr:thiamine phosphate synthase [Gemmatimonadota bacterium]